MNKESGINAFDVAAELTATELDSVAGGNGKYMNPIDAALWRYMIQHYWPMQQQQHNIRGLC